MCMYSKIIKGLNATAFSCLISRPKYRNNVIPHISELSDWFTRCNFPGNDMISRRVEAPCSWTCQCAVCAPLPEEVLLGRDDTAVGREKRTRGLRNGLSHRTFFTQSSLDSLPRVASVNQGKRGGLPPLSFSVFVCVCGRVCKCVYARASSVHRRPALRSADTPGGQSALGSPCHWTICGYKGRSAQIGGDTLVESAAYDLLHEKR